MVEEGYGHGCGWSNAMNQNVKILVSHINGIKLYLDRNEAPLKD